MNTFTALVSSPEEAAAGVQVVNRSSVAALAFLVWDILVTFDDEVKLFWTKPWTYIKSLFFFVRYFPMLVEVSILFVGSDLTPSFHFTPHDCFIWQVYQGVSAISIVVSVDIIFIQRVRALYHNNNVVQVLVVAFFFAEIAGMSVGLGLALPGIRYDIICLVTDVPLTLIIYGAASIFFQTFLFGLTAYKFVGAVRTGWREIPLLVLLMRDGTWAFLVIFAILIAQASLYGLKNHALAGVLYGWTLTTFSFSGYRLLLNIGQLSQHSRDRSTITRTVTNIEFTTHISNDMPETLDSYELSQLSGLNQRQAPTSRMTSTS